MQKRHDPKLNEANCHAKLLLKQLLKYSSSDISDHSEKPQHDRMYSSSAPKKKDVNDKTPTHTIDVQSDNNGVSR